MDLPEAERHTLICRNPDKDSSCDSKSNAWVVVPISVIKLRSLSNSEDLYQLDCVGSDDYSLGSLSEAYQRKSLPNVCCYSTNWCLVCSDWDSGNFVY